MNPARFCRMFGLDGGIVFVRHHIIGEWIKYGLAIFHRIGNQKQKQMADGPNDEQEPKNGLIFHWQAIGSILGSEINSEATK